MNGAVTHHLISVKQIQCISCQLIKFSLTVLVLPVEITTQADFVPCFVAGRPRYIETIQNKKHFLKNQEHVQK